MSSLVLRTLSRAFTFGTAPAQLEVPGHTFSWVENREPYLRSGSFPLIPIKQSLEAQNYGQSTPRVSLRVPRLGVGMEGGCQNMPRHKPGRKEIPVEEQKTKQKKKKSRRPAGHSGL